MRDVDRVLLRRFVEYHQALNDMDVTLDDDTVEAGEQFARILTRWAAARDAVTEHDITRLAQLAEMPS